MQREPEKGFIQPFRNPSCVHYGDCLTFAARLDTVGMRCKECTRFELSDGFDSEVLFDTAACFRLLCVVFYPEAARRLGIHGNERGNEYMER
jgi:hypothetical protein